MFLLHSVHKIPLKIALCEDRTHDLQIMRLTRCLLRQRGLTVLKLLPFSLLTSFWIYKVQHYYVKIYFIWTNISFLPEIKCHSYLQSNLFTSNTELECSDLFLLHALRFHCSVFADIGPIARVSYWDCPAAWMWFSVFQLYCFWCYMGPIAQLSVRLVLP